MNLGIQLYSLRTVDEPLPELIAHVGAMGYQGVEFAYRVSDADPSAVREATDHADLAVAGAHVPADRFDDLSETLTLYRPLECDRFIVPYLDGTRFESEMAVEGTAAWLGELADSLADRDVALGYHNHDHEFATLDEGMAFDHLVRSTPETVGFQIDVGLAALAGMDPVLLLERHGDRLLSVHLKDYDLAAGQSVDLGDGDVPIADCVAVADDAGVEWLIVEFDSSDEPLESADRCLTAVRGLV